jgi:hypothetical protein
LRLVSASAVEQSEEWVTGRRQLNMEELKDWHWKGPIGGGPSETIMNVFFLLGNYREHSGLDLEGRHAHILVWVWDRE